MKVLTVCFTVFFCINSFAASVELLKNYKDGKQLGSIGLILDGSNSATHVYFIDKNVKGGKTQYEGINNIRGGITLLKKIITIISIESKNFDTREGGTITMRYLYKRFNTYREVDIDVEKNSQGKWVVYGPSNNVVSSFHAKVNKDWKGSEVGISSIRFK